MFFMVKEVKGYIAVTLKEKELSLKEEFKGEVMDKEIRFPKGLGAEHPFDFCNIDLITQNVGIVGAAVDKITDSIVGDFSVRIKDPNAQELVNGFLDDSKFYSVLKPWVKEGVSKGNGFLELDFPESKVRVLNANHVYVKRNKKGKVLEYNQFNKKPTLFSSTKDKAIPFKSNQIAHLTINKVPNDPYGMGLLWANRVTVEGYTSAENDLHKLLSRKAGAPIHVTVGQEGEAVQPEDIDAFKGDLQYMTNSTEWVTDANVKIGTIDFSGIGTNLENLSSHDLEQFAIGMQIPMVLMGVANVPEGLAKAQSEAYQRFINSIRVVLEDLIETQILQPFLRSQGMDSKVDFIWELPGEDEKNKRLTIINEALRNPFLSPTLKAGLELEYANIMDLEEVEKILPNPAEAKKIAEEEQRKEQEQLDADRKAEEETIKQPEVPGAKPTANQEAEVELKEIEVSDAHDENCSCGCNLTESQLGKMTIAEFVNLQEIAGFNYSDYLIKILQRLRTDKFSDLKAITEQDISEGLLPSNDIDKLRIILKDGFRKNKTIRQIEKQINQSIDLKDRTKLLEDGSQKITLIAERRPITIARTETVRLANQGLKDIYIENDVTSYRYLAALDDRTSEICNSLNGQVFLTKDGMPGVNMPPMHINCRSSIVGLVD